MALSWDARSAAWWTYRAKLTEALAVVEDTEGRPDWAEVLRDDAAKMRTCAAASQVRADIADKAQQ